MLNFVGLQGFVEESKSISADITSSYKTGCVMSTTGHTAGPQANILQLMKMPAMFTF